jgi:hypothetical protein
MWDDPVSVILKEINARVDECLTSEFLRPNFQNFIGIAHCGYHTPSGML